ncbi:MAG: alpha-L-fucosidase [Oscillospiraceae bacterium]|nr:alpha-L-fucosidase [Oscillospiraceae bacterium]
MIKIKFQDGSTQSYGVGDYALPTLPTEIEIPRGHQAIFYAGENYQGNSVVISAHDGDKSQPIVMQYENAKADTTWRSMRIIPVGEILSGNKRDDMALDAALENGQWLQESFSGIADRLEWWHEDKFGCFVHWGVYAIAGGEYNGGRVFYAEHLQRHFRITQAEYKEQFVDKFNPVEFDAEQWILAAKDAGMRYFAITAKHHDGFAMNPSDACPYDIRMTPFYKETGRDLMMELRDACEKHGLDFGFYYSHAFDWGHQDGPGNDWEFTNGGGDKKLFEGDKGLWFDQYPELVPRTAKYYVDEKSIPQILELIKIYRPKMLWFDTPHKLPPSENLRILQAIREADPTVVVNGRLARNNRFTSCGDYTNTADRAAEVTPFPGHWETIPTTNESYGYSKGDKSHKPPTHFIRLLAKSAARGGNVLMNLGPMANGAIDPVDLDILKGIGEWMKVNGESIYGTSRSPLPVQTFGETTLKGNTLYLHLFEHDGKSVTIGGMITHPTKAYLLADNSKTPLTIKRVNYYDVEISLPTGLAPSCNTVIAVEFDGELLCEKRRLVSTVQTETLRVFDASHVSAGLKFCDGKTGRDYVEGFQSEVQPVIWQVRNQQKATYKLTVKYSSGVTAESEVQNGIGEYFISVGGVKHTGKITATEKPYQYAYGEFEVTINGDADVIFQVGNTKGAWLRLYGVTLEPTATGEQGECINEDDTDVGG